MNSTDLVPIPAQAVSVFPGATPDARIAAATDAATRLSDVVHRQKMLTRINGKDHIQIEAWQTIGALTGVYASRGFVTELPWPTIAEWFDDVPEPPGREPRNTDTPEWKAWKHAILEWDAWELHSALLRARQLGRAYGYKAEYFATKDGADVGWGESSCSRGETSKAAQEDFAIRSMAETRAQSRALGAPLKFVVKLAGYETTSAEELDGMPTTAPSPIAAPWGPVVEDNEQLEAAVKVVQAIAPEIDAAKFMLEMGTFFNGVPEANLKMIRALAKRISEARTPLDEPEPVAEAEVVA